MEHRAVVPQLVAPCCAPGEDVRDLPGDGCGGCRLSGGDQAGAGAGQRVGCGVEGGQMVIAAGEQGVDESAFTGADVGDGVLALDRQLLDQA
jgi:hypothetical protein